MQVDEVVCASEVFPDRLRKRILKKQITAGLWAAGIGNESERDRQNRWGNLFFKLMTSHQAGPFFRNVLHRGVGQKGLLSDQASVAKMNQRAPKQP
jgi:hypothetical protein